MKRILVMKIWKKLNNVLTMIFFTIPFTIIMLPIIVIFTIIDSKRYNIKRRFRFLEKFGYTLKKEKACKHEYYFEKSPIIIKIKQDCEYKISYDNGINFVNIYDTEIGTLEERSKLRDVMTAYQDAHPVDKQRGDAVDTAQFFIAFLSKYINK